LPRHIILQVKKIIKNVIGGLETKDQRKQDENKKKGWLRTKNFVQKDFRNES